MKITLRKSGGISGKNWISVLDTDINETELLNLLHLIQKENSGVKKMPDTFSYILTTEANKRKKWKIDVQKIPTDYQHLFKSLFENLQVEE